MTINYSLPAWEIDAAIIYHATHYAHRLACRVFVMRPNARNARMFSIAQHLTACVARLTAVPQFNPITHHHHR